ncbi:MAG TPA: chitobiase/beta-hexosaminidase C-terminal domain-containing protein [Dongiaceae bacterium]|nr:chitobiase/beta-hexosaminidase C-terminal domain-containing protein [Dongiaceae bacterium]
MKPIKSAVISIALSLLAGCGGNFEWFPDAGTSSTSSTSSTTTVPAADNTAPVTTANPAGKTFSNAFTVTLTANEPATIYYTTNGVDPTTTSINGANTVPNIPISTTTTLKFFAVDSSGNKEAIKTETYTATGSITVTF